VGSRQPENRRLALERLRQAGVEIAVVESVLFEMLRVAGTDVFKQVARLIRG